MPTFSVRSLDKLITCDSRLIDIFKEVVKGYDCTILVGWRSQEEQDEAYRLGHSKLRFPHSKHNQSPSLAVDAAPCHQTEPHIDWNDTGSFYHFAGYVKRVADEKGIVIRWGGDWDSDLEMDDQTFMDLVHFELIDG